MTPLRFLVTLAMVCVCMGLAYAPLYIIGQFTYVGVQR